MVGEALNSVKCKQLVEFKKNDDGSITYTDVNGDMSEAVYVPERTCKGCIFDGLYANNCSFCIRDQRLTDQFIAKVVE